MRRRLPVRLSRGWKLAIAMIACLVAVSTATVRLFVLPDRGMPSQVSAIVMLNGTGDRLGTALALAWAHRAPYLIISRGSQVFGHGSDCAPRIPHETIICFDPDPSTTKGEAEFVGRLAKRFGWRSLVLVTTTPQASRGRLRVGRCFAGPVYAVTTPPPLSSWPYEIVYEWAATVKALIFQRSC